MESEPTQTRDLIAAVTAQAGSDDPLVLLEHAVAASAATGRAAEAMVDHFVALCRSADLSWTVIGERLGVTKQAARQKYAARIGAPDLGVDIGRAVIAPALAACLDAARTEAAADESDVSTHHLLLGLLHAGHAATVLDKACVTRDRIREAADRLLTPVTVTGVDGRERRLVGDGAAEASLAIAHQIAARRGQSEVRTEHLLFELAVNESATSRRILDDLGIDTAQIKKHLNQVIPPHPARPRRRSKPGCDPKDRACAFCGCTDPNRPMVAGPGVWICSHCVALSTQILTTQQLAHRST